MSIDAYKELLKKYLQGKCTEEEEGLVEDWYNDLNISSQKLEDLKIEEIDYRLWNSIKPITVPKERFNNKLLYTFYKLTAAASLLIAALFYYNYTRLVPVSYLLSSNKIETTNASNMTEDVLLADGTTVKLYPQSSISYSKGFSKKQREVYLNGKAFFNVAKDKKRPFLIHSHHNTIRVLGTSFLVQSKKDITQNFIEVMTGKVWVEEKSVLASAKQVVLTPNQKLTFDAQADKFTSTIVSSPKPMKKNMEEYETEVAFSFSDSPLTTVVNALEDMYGLKIELNNPKLHSCTFTGNLNDEDLFKKLELLCTSIGAKYTIENTKILIDGKGCQ